MYCFLSLVYSLVSSLSACIGIVWGLLYRPSSISLFSVIKSYCKGSGVFIATPKCLAQSSVAEQTLAPSLISKLQRHLERNGQNDTSHRDLETPTFKELPFFSPQPNPSFKDPSHKSEPAAQRSGPKEWEGLIIELQGMEGGRPVPAMSPKQSSC